MPVLRYIAVTSEDPERLAAFYCQALAMEELGRSPAGDVALTDGHFNLSLLRARHELGEDGRPIGLHHVGFAVDSIEEIAERLSEIGGGKLQEEPGDLWHGEFRLEDPNGLPVSLSTRAFGLGDRGRRLPGVHHVAYSVRDPEKGLDFYTRVFGVRELSSSVKRRAIGRPNRFAGDGYTNLTLHPYPNTTADSEPREGFNHIGMLVTDAQEIVDRLGEDIRCGPRPSNRAFAEYRLWDPDGNAVDLSAEKGYEVDFEKWETGGSNA